LRLAQKIVQHDEPFVPSTATFGLTTIVLSSVVGAVLTEAFAAGSGAEAFACLTGDPATEAGAADCLDIDASLVSALAGGVF